MNATTPTILSLAEKVDALTKLGLQFASECGDCNGTRICPDGSPCDMCSDNDPTPWCAGCGSMTQAGCDCGPIAENN